MIVYESGNDVDLDAAIDVYRTSTLGEMRPLHDRARMKAMLERADIVVTAWHGTKLVGIARSISDFVYCTYVSDLAVDVAYQRRGIGRELVRQTQRLGGPATLVLFAAPAAVEYYPHIGFVAGSGWMLRENDRLR